MNKKQLAIICGISLSVLIVITIVSMSVLDEKPKNSLSADEINTLEQSEKPIGPYGSSFSGGNMTFHEEWCTTNNGIWDKNDNCTFKTYTDSELANIALEKLTHPSIGGETAQKICKFLDLSCPDHVVFSGYLHMIDGKTFVNYDYKNVSYKFDVSTSEIKYKIEDNPQWHVLDSEFNRDEHCTDHIAISLSTPKKFYFPGDEIIMSGTISCSSEPKQTVPKNIPITIQIISNDDLIDVAQIEIAFDGKFTHLINAMGPQWQQSGTYAVKAFYGEGYDAETDFDFFADVDPKSKNELQVSNDLVLVGETVTVFGNISNPAAEYVIIRVFNENNGEMENIRKTLDDAGFYWQDIKIQSSWPVGTYSVSIMPSEFDSVVYFDVLGTEEIWGDTNKSIQNFP